MQIAETNSRERGKGVVGQENRVPMHGVGLEVELGEEVSGPVNLILLEAPHVPKQPDDVAEGDDYDDEADHLEDSCEEDDVGYLDEVVFGLPLSKLSLESTHLLVLQCLDKGFQIKDSEPLQDTSDFCEVE